MLDYSRISRHLLATAGDDGSIHLWDTIGRGPKVGNAMLSFQTVKVRKLFSLGVSFKITKLDELMSCFFFFKKNRNYLTIDNV